MLTFVKTWAEHTHFRNGLSISARMIRHECPVKKIVYTSKDPAKPKVVVIFEGRHSHPPWPEEKPTHEAKEDLRRCLKAFGITGATAGKLDNGQAFQFNIENKMIQCPLHSSSAPTTIAILGSMLSAKHSAFWNRKVLHEKISEKKR